MRLPAADAPARVAVQQRMLAAAGRLRGVKSASAATPDAWLGLGPEDRVRTLCDRCAWGNMYAPQLIGTARMHAVSPGWFRSMGIRVLAGRELRPDDGRAVLINRVFAATLLPRANPVGQRVIFRGWWDDPYTVVGVVADARAPGPGTGGAPEPTLYLSALQHPPAHPCRRRPHHGRSRGPRTPHPPRPGHRRAGRPRRPRRADADAAGPPPRTAPLVRRAPRGARRGRDGGGGGRAVRGDGVQRGATHAGDRGADGDRRHRAHVLRQVLGEALRITLIGGIVGSIGAITLARLLEDMFYGVDPFDLTTYLGVAVVLAAVTITAAYRPAVRAARVHPDQALRSE
ncbi:MAG TPA: ABC transporter permease [Longimicrobium sp.]|nr:ABC transporter permease [Longimicrobium sp.]